MLIWDTVITFVIVLCAIFLLIIKIIKEKNVSCTGCNKKCTMFSQKGCHEQQIAKYSLIK